MCGSTRRVLLSAYGRSASASACRSVCSVPCCRCTGGAVGCSECCSRPDCGHRSARSVSRVAYAPGGRTPSGERDWRSWRCESCIASPLCVALDLRGTAGSPGRLRTACVPLSRVPLRLRRRVTRSPRAAPPGQARAACAGSRGQVCRSSRLRPVGPNPTLKP
jgi:hypothetical protein